MSGRMAGRAREWMWAQPGRARAAALTAAVVVAVAGGAVAVLQPGDPTSSGRTRHDRGALATGPAAPGTTGTGGEAGVPPSTEGGVTPGAPGGGSPDGTPATTGAGRAGAAPAGGSTTTAGGVDPTATTGPDGRATGSTKPRTPSTAPGAAATPRGTAPAGPGWKQLPGAPIAGREGHNAVWTGREMVIWGGIADPAADPLTDGAAYDPAARTWRKIAAAPLTPRTGAQAFWTGFEMVVFGGFSVEVDPLMDGAAWNPATNSWRRIAAPQLSVRDGMVIAWAGDRLVAWGGATVPTIADPDAETVMHNDGAAWVAATGTWVAMPAAPITPRSAAESVWTGTRLVVTGGYNLGEEDDRRDGAAFDPVSATWSPITARPAPGSCGGVVPCAGIWTGSVALFPGSGLAYDPAGDRWSAMAALPAGDGLVTEETTVWTGRRLLMWGSTPPASDGDEGDEVQSVEGGDEEIEEGDETTDDVVVPEESSSDPAVGFAYDLAGNRWQAFPAGPLAAREYHSAVWTGEEMLVWGGNAGEAGLTDGAAYRPEG
jgi:N-acetylneuraminic acid mutarotase